MIDPRLGAVLRNPDLLRDLVGGSEADPVNVFRQCVRIAAHFFDCLFPVGLEDAHRPAGAHAMAVQEQHDLADLLRLLPCLRDPLPALGADPAYRLQFGWAAFDDGKNVGPEVPHEFLGEDGADPFNKSAAEIPLDSLGGGRWHGLLILPWRTCSEGRYGEPVLGLSGMFDRVNPAATFRVSEVFGSRKRGIVGLAELATSWIPTRNSKNPSAAFVVA
jgi:hypothetical protein